jgi:hypothetical protein
VNDTRRHDLFAVTLLSVIATLLFLDVLAGTHNFYIRDLTRYYYPTKQILRDIVLQGEFPWWNRLFGAGQPIAANPEHEVFYPLTWLILLPDYFLGYRLHVLAHIYIGLAGMYALLRSMDLRAAASFFGAFAFGLGGIYLSYINLLPILFCVAWLPFTCLFVRRFMLRPSLRDFCLACLFLGTQCLVGEPTTIMQTGFILGMYALYRGWYAARDFGHPIRAAIPEMLSRVAFIGLISIAGFAMGAAQILPAIDHVADSARSRPFDFSLVSAWSMPWPKLAEMIYPNVLGHISVNRVMWYWGGGLYPGMGSPFLFSIYPGLLITSLAVAALFIRPRGGRFVLILSLFSVLLASGSHSPFLGWLYEAGVATSIRYPEKFLLIALFAITIFASQLLDRMLRGDETVRSGAMGFAAATAVVAAAIAAAAFTTQYGEIFREVWGASGGGAKRMIAISRTDWMIAAARGALLLGLFTLLPRMRRALWLSLLGIFVIADLGPIGYDINPRMPAAFFTKVPDARAQLPERDDYRLFHEADWYGQTAIARRYFGTGDAVYWIVRNGLYPMTPAGHGVAMAMDRDYDKTALLPTIDFVQSVWDVKRSGREDWWRPMMAMSNAWYRAQYRDFETEKKRVNGRMRRAQAVDFREAEHAPRYYFADQMISIRDRQDFVDRLSKGGDSLRAAFVRDPSFDPAPGTVLDWRETPNTAVIDVESSGRGFLIMSVTPHAYWSITVDGQPVEPRITNIGYQGIEVPAGRHRVEMRYSNPVAIRSMKISAVTLVMLLAGALVPRRRRFS